MIFKLFYIFYHFKTGDKDLRQLLEHFAVHKMRLAKINESQRHIMHAAQHWILTLHPLNLLQNIDSMCFKQVVPNS